MGYKPTKRLYPNKKKRPSSSSSVANCSSCNTSTWWLSFGWKTLLNPKVPYTSKSHGCSMMQYPVVTLPNANKEGFMTWMCICENPSLQLVDIWFVHAVINMLSPTYLPLFQSIISDQVVLINVKLGLIIPAVLINPLCPIFFVI